MKGEVNRQEIEQVAIRAAKEAVFLRHQKPSKSI